MKVFKINDNIFIVCRSEGTRYGFRHLASLMLNGYELEKAKVCYYNRTWESFEFESVIKQLADKSDYKKEIEEYLKLDLDWYGMPKRIN